MHIAITIGGALIGFLLLVPAGATWWQANMGKRGSSGPPRGGKGAAPAVGGSKKEFRSLAPTGATLFIGALASTSVGGAVGNSAQKIDQQANTGGDHFMHGMTGVGSQEVARHTTALLQPGGALVLILALVAMLYVGYRVSWHKQWRMICGLVAGCILGPTSGLSGLIASVGAPVVNWAGNLLVGGLHW